MFVPDFDQNSWKNSFNPSSDSEQRFLVGNHLDVLAGMISDSLRRDALPASAPDAISRVLHVLDEYLDGQARERPQSWAVRLRIRDTVGVLLDLVGTLDPADHAGTRRRLEQMHDLLHRLISRTAS